MFHVSCLVWWKWIYLYKELRWNRIRHLWIRSDFTYLLWWESTCWGSTEGAETRTQTSCFKFTWELKEDPRKERHGGNSWFDWMRQRERGSHWTNLRSLRSLRQHQPESETVKLRASARGGLAPLLPLPLLTTTSDLNPLTNPPRDSPSHNQKIQH